MRRDDGYDFGQSMQNGLDNLLGAIPNILGIILLLLVGWILAVLARRLTVVLLRRLRFERAVTLSPAGNYITRVIEHPTAFIGKVVYWLIWLAFILFALSSVGVPALTNIVNGIYAYVPNIIAAIAIFLVASAITAGAEAFISKVLAPGALARLLATVVPAIIMPIAVFMILNQLHIAQDIVNITYTAIVGAVALGLALAFGLGGRDVAARILEQAYQNAQDNAEQMKNDARQAKRDTRAAADRTRRATEDNM